MTATGWLLAPLLAAAAYASVVGYVLRRRRLDIWWRDYVRHLAERPRTGSTRNPTHVMFCFVDHFEPRWGNASEEVEHERVRRWVEDYPRVCRGHRDADGRAPRHTFFFPSEEYRPEHLERLAALCRDGYGEIEVHLHHDRDTEAGLRANLSEFITRLADAHDALPRDASGRALWSFVHGNWALDNSRPDGRWCGVDNELTVLADMGCYADFTLPSAPSPTQTATVNSIYYAADDPCHPKSHDRGEAVRVGGSPSGHLMIIQGPLCLRWKRRAAVPVPAIENGDIRASNPPTAARVDAWVRHAPRVRGRPEWAFVKVHTHGTQTRDMDALLGEPVERMFSVLESRYNDGRDFKLHYVSAREMYNIVKAAERGLDGDPGAYRDLVIPAPRYRPARGVAP